MVTIVSQPVAAHLPNLRVIEDCQALHRFLQSPEQAYFAKNGHIYTQENPTGFFSFLIRFIQILERWIYEQKFPDDPDILNELLTRSKDLLPDASLLFPNRIAALSAIDKQTLTTDLISLCDDLQKMALEALRQGRIEPKNSENYLSLLEHAKREMNWVSRNSCHPLQNGARLDRDDPITQQSLYERFLATSPDETDRMVREAFETARFSSNPFRDIHELFSHLVDTICLMMTHRPPTDAVIEHTARHLCAFNRAIHADYGFNTRAILFDLESYLLLAEQWITCMPNGTEIFRRVSTPAAPGELPKKSEPVVLASAEPVVLASADIVVPKPTHSTVEIEPSFEKPIRRPINLAQEIARSLRKADIDKELQSLKSRVSKIVAAAIDHPVPAKTADLTRQLEEICHGLRDALRYKLEHGLSPDCPACQMLTDYQCELLNQIREIYEWGSR